jgi:hypothetical protein
MILYRSLPSLVVVFLLCSELTAAQPVFGRKSSRRTRVAPEMSREERDARFNQLYMDNDALPDEPVYNPDAPNFPPDPHNNEGSITLNGIPQRYRFGDPHYPDSSLLPPSHQASISQVQGRYEVGEGSTSSSSRQGGREVLEHDPYYNIRMEPRQRDGTTVYWNSLGQEDQRQIIDLLRARMTHDFPEYDISLLTFKTAQAMSEVMHQEILSGEKWRIFRALMKVATFRL